MPAAEPSSKTVGATRTRRLARRLRSLLVCAALVLGFAEPLLATRAAATTGLSTTHVAVTASLSGTTLTLSATVTPVTATGSPTSTAPSPAGTVTFETRTPTTRKAYLPFASSPNPAPLTGATGTNAATATSAADVATLPTGSITVYAAYSGNSEFAAVKPAQSTAATFTVAHSQSPATSPSKTASVVVATTPTVADPGTPVTLSATVKPTTATATAPTGSVTFARSTPTTPTKFVALGGSVTLAHAPSSSTATASSRVTTLPSGSYPVYAEYSGSSTFSAVAYTASTASQVTVLYRVGVSAQATPTESAPGSTIILTATVTPTTSRAPAPTGYVTFAMWTATQSAYVKIGTYTSTNPANGAPAAHLVAASGTNVATATAKLVNFGSGTFEAYTKYSPSTPPRFEAVTYAGSQPVQVTASTPSPTKTATALTFFDPETSPAAPLAYPQIADGSPILLRAHVTTATTPTSPITSGTVYFYDTSTTPRTTIGHATLDASGYATFTDTTSWTAGTHTIKAAFTGPVSYAVSTHVRKLDVLSTPAPTATTVSAAPSPPLYGQSVALTATVTTTGRSDGATGTVDFLVGGTLVGHSSLSPVATASHAFAASISYSPTGIGQLTVTAKYVGDLANKPSQGTSTVTVKDSTAVAASGAQTPADPAKVTLSATLSAAHPTTSGTPTGTVVFHEQSATGTTLCAATLTSGTGSCTTTALAPGTDTVVAVYGGDTSHAGSELTFTVVVSAPTPTTTAVTASPSLAVLGQTVTLTVAVTGNSPTGTVGFTVGTTTLCTVTLSAGVATCPTTDLGLGTDTVTATYSGDARNLGSSGTVEVEVAPGLRSCSPSSPGASCKPWLLTGASPRGPVLLATGSARRVSILYLSLPLFGGSQLATGAQGPVAEVFSGTTLVELLPVSITTRSSWQLDLDLLSFTIPATLPTGTYTVQITVRDRGGDCAQYVWQVDVGTTPTKTVVTASPSLAVLGQTVTLTARVTGNRPAGTVSFTVGTTTLCTVTLTARVATCSTTDLGLGTDTVTATYSGDGRNLGSSGAVEVQVVPQRRRSPPGQPLPTDPSDQGSFSS